MATSNANLERRIERNTNDIEAIYDLLTDHGEQLTAIQSKLAEHDARFESIDQRFESIDARFESIDARFESVDARFDKVDMTLAEVLRRLPEPPTSQPVRNEEAP